MSNEAVPCSGVSAAGPRDLTAPVAPAPIAPARAYLPKAKVILAAADAVCIAAAVAASIGLHVANPAGFVVSEPLRVACAWLVFIATAYGCGVYDSRAVACARASLAPTLFTSSAAGLLAFAILFGPVSAKTGALVASTAAFIAFGSMVLARFAVAAPGFRGILGSRCLVIGDGEGARAVIRLSRENPHARLSVIGRVQDFARWRPGEPDQTCPVLGTLQSLEDIVSTQDVDVIVVTASMKDEPDLTRRLRGVRYLGIKVMDFAALHEELAREIALDHVDERWLFMAATSNSRIHARYLKRITDVVGSVVLLVPASIVLGVAAAAIKISSSGPVLFRQERLGLGGKPFMVLKLRSMYEDAEGRTGPMWSTENDPRITPVGRMLRKFRIDELPQLVNVLRGDMSLIGPRPERPVFTEKIAASLPLFMERLMVRPGITGWAQVMAPYAMTVEDSHRKLQFDLYYAKHMSFWLDALIAVKTVRTMVFGRERSQGGMSSGGQSEASAASSVRPLTG